jgi:hypothetical protein
VITGGAAPGGYFYAPSAYTLVPSGVTAGCAGAAPSGYVLVPASVTAGCGGAAPSGYTCGGGSPGASTTPRPQTMPQADTSDLDARLARWGKGGVSVRVEVKVWVNGTLVEPGTPPNGQPSDPRPEDPTNLLERLKAAFKEDQDVRKATAVALKNDIVPSVRSLGERFRDARALRSSAALRRSFDRFRQRLPEFAKTLGEVDRHLDTLLGDTEQELTEAQRRRVVEQLLGLAEVLQKVAP